MNCLIQKSFHVDSATGYTAGHFEGHPIVPGAVSLKWMLDALAQGVGTDVLASCRIRNFKCLQELPPPCEVTLTVQERKPAVYSVQLQSDALLIATVEVDYPFTP